MTSAFSSSDAAAIDRTVELDSSECTLGSFWDFDQLKRCQDWIVKENLLKVCLQFPDVLLPFSAIVAEQLQEGISASIHILGDTSYGSCCVDEIAASHVGADGIIHFGHACLSRSVRLPTLYVFFKGPVNIDAFTAAFRTEFKDSEAKIGLFYDVSFAHCISDIECKLKTSIQSLKVARLADSNQEADVLCWKIDGSFEEYTCVYIGHDNQSFFNTANAIEAEKWYRFDPESEVLAHAVPINSKWLRRRFYFIEKCKDAASLGIVVATLTASGYLDIVNRIQQLAKIRGVRTYIISVGKINPAKLANFMDIDCFVLVGCPENDLYTSRDFFKPLISVFECEIALNPAWSGQFPSSYSTDFMEMLPSGRMYKSFDADGVIDDTVDVSLVTGKVRNVARKEAEELNGNSCTSIQVRSKNEVAVVNSGEVFQDRSWQGLEQNLGRDAPVAVEDGRRGIPMKYNNDPSDR